ncbi:MAG TPA: hypothetical protein VGH28_07115 [Polyangiaceae bacterium]
MTYLYGDSTESGLSSNFLELLRDALDFAVVVLEADESIGKGRDEIARLRAEADEELARLDAFEAFVADAIARAEKGAEGSPTALCAGSVSELLEGSRHATSDAVRGKLAADVAAIEAQEAATRATCHEALAAFLAPHGPIMTDPFEPTAAASPATQRIALLDSGVYHATLAGRATFGVDWVFGLHVPAGNLWSEPVRLERIAEHVEIKTPQVTGWLNKEVKVRPQRLERHVVTELETDGVRTRVKLRLEGPAESGFDLAIDRSTGAPSMKAVRIGPSDDTAAGAFDLDEADVATLLGIVDKIVEAGAELEIATLGVASFEGVPFREAAVFAPVVDRLVAELAPIVHAIALRSLTPTELVLRRALSDDRREEFFVTKATLREKFEGLSPPLRAHFDALALTDTTPSPQGPTAPSASRREIHSSRPPPSSKSPQKNEAFVEAVKKIMMVLKSGRTDEGYAQYADLLSSSSFGEYRPDEQRQALKLLLLAKAPESRSDEVMRAYKIALARIQALVDTHADPADYEMLGVAHVQLDDRAAASNAFQIALKLERARNPSSDLCASLGRRLAQISPPPPP